MVDMEEQTPAVSREISPAVSKKSNLSVALKFEDVVYEIKTKPRRFEQTAVKILKGITGMVMPGEMLAILGPSGSGKTTLLTALGGRLLGSGHLSGSITYNGKPFSSNAANMKRTTGFVPQADILHPHLTVTETLVYTALLRLPSLTKDEKVQQAESVINQLGLSRCKNTIIGKGVSGGEKKRVSIAQEMLINPCLLFLDEPTSSLDSTNALRLVSTLKELAEDGGRTIVMTIHQPSTRLYYMFYKILLLCDGNPLFFGKGSHALDYFSSIGFAPSVVAMNPADFLLDLANGVSTADDETVEIQKTLVSAYSTYLSNSVKSKLIANDDNHGVLHLHLPPGGNKKQLYNKKWPNNWWVQFSVLLMRGIKERKHESFTVFKIIEVLIVAIVSGLLWWKSNINHLQDQLGLFFFFTSFWGFHPLLQAIYTFPQECMILSKERSSGMYRLSSYFMARTLGDLPMELVLPTISYTITYWMAGLKASADSFLLGLLVLLYSVLCTQGLGLSIGALVMDPKPASTLGSVITSTSLLVTGYYVQHVPKFVAWIKYISIPHYTYKLFLASQYTPGQIYLCATNKTCLVEDFPAIKNIGLDDGNAMCVIAMAILLVGYRLVAYIALMRIGITRKI